MTIFRTQYACGHDLGAAGVPQDQEWTAGSLCADCKLKEVNSKIRDYVIQLCGIPIDENTDPVDFLIASHAMLVARNK